MGKSLDGKIIAIDGAPLFRQIDGIARYTNELVFNLAKNNPNTQIRIIAFSNDKDTEPLLQSSPNVTIDYLPFPRKLYNLVFKLFFRLPINRLLKFKPDVILYFNFVTTPYIDGVPSILFIHDLAFLDIPETVSEKNRQYLQKFVPYSLSKTDKIIAISSFTKKRLIKKYPETAGSNITVISPAINHPPILKKSELREVRALYGLPSKYVLFVGTIEPRKNLINLLRAYENVNVNEIPPLVVIGVRGWNLGTEIDALMKDLVHHKKLYVLGYVRDEDLIAIFQQAIVFVCPSLYEGYGIPIAEAMANNTAVTVSDKEPMKSIAPKSSPKFDPLNPEEIFSAVRLLTNDEQIRTKSKQEGLRKVATMTWERSAKLLEREVERLLKNEKDSH